jgi:hypothetical protein
MGDGQMRAAPFSRGSLRRVVYETSNWIDSFATGDAGADAAAAHGARSAAEYSESGAKYSGCAAGAFTGSEYAWVAQFSFAGSE